MRRYEDQQKVRRAIAAQRVDSADIPATAKTVAPPAVPPMMESGPSIPGPSSIPLAGQKRKYQLDAAGTSQSLGKLGIPHADPAKGLLSDEDDEVMLIEPESVDELYCVMETSIVGVQYYTGMYFVALSQVSSCLPNIQVLLRPENKSGSSESCTIDMTGKI